jgi:serine/threonine protein kinase
MEVGTTFNNITILDKIAEGGMGEIFKASQKVSELFERIVVVKNIKENYVKDEMFIEMFFQEAKITAKLIHENIVQIYDLNKHQEEYYILMEYIDGKDLLQIGKTSFKKGRRIPIPMIVKIIEQACNGLKYAHEFCDPTGKSYNIVHRDISLQNIMVTFSGMVKILDFGVMQTTEVSNLEMMSKIPGKVNYMSPELIMGHDADPRSDIFSLGIILYQLLTGKKPFRDKDIEVLMEKILHEEPVFPSRYVDLPDHLEDIILKMLSKDPSKRYQTVSELQQELEEFLLNNNMRVNHYDISEYLEDVFEIN